MGQSGGNFFDELANVVTNVATIGLVGYEGGGKFGQGGLTNMVDEGIGEVTGRNASRDALWQQRVDMEKEVARRQSEMDAQIARRGQDDLAASNAAGAMRTNSNSNRSITSAASAAMERDFLGL